MAPGTNGSRIVDQWAGEGTGDVDYMTADGRCWTTARPLGAGGTGEARGHIVGDRIVPTTREEADRG